MVFLSFSTYTVASASAALPGDWQYPSSSRRSASASRWPSATTAKRDVKLDIAEERAREIEQLTANGKIIGPGVLDRLVEQTSRLSTASTPAGTQGTSRASRRSLSATSAPSPKRSPRSTLTPTPPSPRPRTCSNRGLVVASQIIVSRPAAPPEVVKPSKLLASPTPTDTPEATGTPGASETQDRGPPTAPAATTTPGGTL